ncbi:MAG: PorV/PorQ family protein [Candidatus Eisenbacteria bacterium]|uniref:PorV/PorQ family protein n=1 Tax=Eiseniibacteriota bacterium TaxID=2212470 RepID=A0A956NF30_UNCEI|nr:PorV/PorQ family protein [Candidatus Eisenbacteria bacterium]MCB9462669.1 PorV/PorQ family protein [Candidatus Eisenbacteria bacterium]
MRRILQTTTILLATSLVATSAWAGSERRIGTAGAQELRIPVGTRGIALGGATVSAQHGLESVYYNPAGLAGGTGTEALFANTSYLAETDVRYFGISTETGLGNIAATIKVLDLGQLEVTTEDAPEGTGEVSNINFTVFGLSMARYLTDAVSFGVTGYYINESIIDVSARGMAFDLGLNYDMPWRGARFGLVMKNFGPDMTFSGAGLDQSVQIPGSEPGSRPRILSTQSAGFELPSYFQIGGQIPAWESGDNQVMAYGTYLSNNFSKDEVRGGVEYAYRDVLMLRGGVDYADQSEYLFGPTFGAGFNLPLGAANLSVDYAFQSVDSYFDDLHTFSAHFRF